MHSQRRVDPLHTIPPERRSLISPSRLDPGPVEADGGASSLVNHGRRDVMTLRSAVILIWALYSLRSNLRPDLYRHNPVVSRQSSY